MICNCAVQNIVYYLICIFLVSVRCESKHYVFEPHNSLELLQHQLHSVNLQPRVQCNVSATHFKPGDWIDVQCSGIQRPSKFDYVGLFAQVSGNPFEQSPLQYRMCHLSDHYLNSGQILARFKVHSFRYDVVAAVLQAHGPKQAQPEKSLGHRKSQQQWVVTGHSNTIINQSPNEPHNAHLALGEEPSTMVVQWTSKEGQQPTVQYGTDADHLTHSTGGSTFSYSFTDLCGPPANTSGWIPSGQLHRVFLRNLDPSTRYYYTYGDAANGIYADVESFVTPPATPTSVAVFAIADWGLGDYEMDQYKNVSDSCSSLSHAHPENRVTHPYTDDPRYASTRDDDVSVGYDNKAPAPRTPCALVNMARIKKDIENGVLHTWHQSKRDMSSRTKQRNARRVGPHPIHLFSPKDVQGDAWTLLMHNGDISYANGQESIWDTYYGALKGVGTRVPMMICMGNHERDYPMSGDLYGVYDSGGECGIPTTLRNYVPPSPSPAPPDAMWYSFDHGPMHVLQYNTELDFTVGSLQYNFIENDLRNVDRRKTPWVVVGGHRPIYVDSSFSGFPWADQEVAQQLQLTLEPLFVKYKVDLTLHGHHHAYQRTCPVINGECVGYNDDSSARAPVHLVVGNGGGILTPFPMDTTPNWLVKNIYKHGYARMYVGTEQLLLDMVCSETGEVMDTVQLVKAQEVLV